MKKIDWASHRGVVLLEALHNASPEVVGGDSDGNEVRAVYGRGVVVGVMAGIVHWGQYFDDVWEQIVRRVDVDPRCLPEGWPSRADYDEYRRTHGNGPFRHKD